MFLDRPLTRQVFEIPRWKKVFEIHKNNNHYHQGLYCTTLVCEPSKILVVLHHTPKPTVIIKIIISIHIIGRLIKRRTSYVRINPHPNEILTRDTFIHFPDLILLMISKFRTFSAIAIKFLSEKRMLSDVTEKGHTVLAEGNLKNLHGFTQ